jgi:hypothetical protein
VYEVVKGDLHAIPNIYASIFGSRELPLRGRLECCCSTDVRMM